MSSQGPKTVISSGFGCLGCGVSIFVGAVVLAALGVGPAIDFVHSVIGVFVH